MADAPGVDREVNDALDLIERDGERYPDGSAVTLALNYLHATVPVNTQARALLAILADTLASYRRGRVNDVSGISEFGPVADVLGMLRHALDTAGFPRLERPDTPAGLAALAARLGVRGDWHEPDEQDVDARVVTRFAFDVTAGSFDNAGHRVLEQTVVIYQDLVPVAEVALATLFAWACQGADTDPPPPRAVAERIPDSGDRVAA